MGRFKRVFVIVIDSLGVGPMPDSEKFGDVGVDTLGHIAEHMEHFQIPNLVRPGAVILVKASRGMAFEELTREIQRLAPKA